MQKPYRLNVGIILFNGKGQVLMGERADNLGSWQLPQGGVDEGESLLLAAKRELLEETGISINAEPAMVHPDFLYYDFPSNIRPSLRKYRGQQQRWFWFHYEGETPPIEETEQEFTQLKWVALQSISDNIVEFKRDIYKELILRTEELFKQIGVQRS